MQKYYLIVTSLLLLSVVYLRDIIDTSSKLKAIMLTSRFAISAPKIVKRSIWTNVPALQKASDPIQQLFLDKIREYKIKSAGGKLVDANPEIVNERQSELEKINIQYGGDKGIDMTKFPEFKFQDPPVEMGLDKSETHQ